LPGEDHQDRQSDRGLDRFGGGEAAVMPIVLAAAGGLGLSLLSGSAFWKGPLAIAILYVACYLPARNLLTSRAERIAIADVLILTILGWAVLAVLGAVAMRVSIPPEGAAVFMGIFALRRRRAQSVAAGAPRMPFNWLVVIAALAVLSVLPQILGSIRIGLGAAPRIFIDVDTTYYLTQIHSLSQSDRYPPLSLGYDGYAFFYHFGTQMMAAMITRLSGLAPHNVLGLLWFPLIQLGILATTLRILLRAGGGSPPAAAVGLLLLGFLQHHLTSFTHEMFLPDVFWTLDSTILWMPSNLFANFLALLTLLAFMTPDPLIRSKTIVVILASAGFFKQSALVPIVLGSGWWLLLEGVAARSARPLRPWIVGCIAGAAVYLSLVSDTQSKFVLSTARASIFPPDFFRAQMLRAHLPLAVLACFALAARRISVSKLQLQLVGFLVLPFVFVMLFGMAWSNREGSANFFQAVHLAPIFLAMIVWTIGVQTMRSSAGAVVCALCVLAWSPYLLNRVYAIYVTAVDPYRSPLVVDNAQLLPVLERLPVEGTLFVTNDVRFPSEGYSRAMLQVQIPAIRGHRCFNCNMSFEVPEGFEQRQHIQELLEFERWNGDLQQLARQYGWTHFLVRKNYRHPRDIPLDLAFDTDHYAVYKF
jgi:hypothetical protein